MVLLNVVTKKVKFIKEWDKLKRERLMKAAVPARKFSNKDLIYKKVAVERSRMQNI